MVRISGPVAGSALSLLSRPPHVPEPPFPQPRRAALRRLHGPDGGILDVALVLWFPAPHSFTGENVAELHVHGGRAVLAGILDALAAIPGLRPAAAGEFTRRAFDAGRLDLTAVEGLADLVAAETPAQRRQALRQLTGDLARIYEGWAARLIRALAWLEAEIDFADEDLPAGIGRETRRTVAAVGSEIAAHLADGRRGEILRDGFTIAILGPPNAGKSSLLNALAQRDAAIVADTAGTTRDVVEVRMDLGGYPVVVADTAGLHEGGEAVEREGMRRALALGHTADLVLLLLDATAPEVAGAEIRTVLDARWDAPLLVCVNKVDRVPLPPATRPLGIAVLPISVHSGEGMPALLEALRAAVAGRLGGADDGAPVLSRLRHRLALEAAADHLERCGRAGQPDMAAEDLRLALRELGRITGRVDVEDLLDVIFRDFCIGK